MRHVILTCKNHPDLRWSCKEIAFSSEHGYNGQRHLFFKGFSLGKMYSDNSGLNCSLVHPTIPDKYAEECSCSSSNLILAPEDVLVKRD